MDLADSLSGPTPFRCTCTWEFTQESAYTRHQRSCSKSKKQLFSVLSKAKDLLGSAKRSRVDNNSGRHSSSMQFDCPRMLLSYDQVNEMLNADLESSNIHPTAPEMHPAQQMSCDSSSHNAPTSVSNLDTASMLEDEGLSLAQQRSRHTGVPKPLRYRQYDDVLPQPPPPPSIPSSHADQQLELNLPANSTNASTGACTSSLPPFHTAKNVFGLVHQFFSSAPLSHDLEEVVMLQDNEDAGWHKTQVTIEVPFSQTTAQPGARPYVAADLYHPPLVSVIREKLSNAQDDKLFHYEPYQLRWSAPHLQHEVTMQGKLYTSPAFVDAHRELQESPGEPGCNLPCIVAALMFWSDATHLTTFGNMKLWPVYMYFGNESKYRRCKPSCNLGNHVAYFQKV